MMSPLEIATDGYLTTALRSSLVNAVSGWINGAIGVPFPDTMFLSITSGKNEMAFARSHNRVMFAPSKNDFTLEDS